MINKTNAIVAVMVTALLASPTIAAKKEPLILSPSTPWNVHYFSNESCRLARTFGKGDEKVFMLFHRFGPGDHFRLSLAGKPVKISRSKHPVTLQFGPNEQPQEIEFFRGSFTKDMPALLFQTSIRIARTDDSANDDSFLPTDLPLLSEERKASVAYLSVGRPLKRSVTLKTGPMAKPFAAFDTCIEQLLTEWGIDVEKHKKLTRKAWPKSDYRKWIKSRDYPITMLSRGQSAIVDFRMNVSKDGIATDCHIQETTRPKAFDKAVCQSLMKRSKFSPALDAEGAPIDSYWLNRVVFAFN